MGRYCEKANKFISLRPPIAQKLRPTRIREKIMIVTVKIVALVKTDNNQYGWLIEQSLEKCKNIVGESTFLFVETKTLPVPIKIKDGKYIDLCDSEWHIVRKNLQYAPQEYDTTQKETFLQIGLPKIPEE